MDRDEPGQIIYEDELGMALCDINPQAPSHILIVPLKPIPTLDDLTEEDEPLVRHLFSVAKKVAAEEGLTEVTVTAWFLTMGEMDSRRYSTSTYTYSVGAGCPGLRARRGPLRASDSVELDS